MSSTALYRPGTDFIRERLDTAAAPVRTSVGPFSLHVTGDIPSLKELWERMQADIPCATSQTYDWARAWAEHVLVPEEREAVIVVGFDQVGAPCFLWPFETSTVASLRVLKWLAQDHANYSMGLFDSDMARRLTRADMSKLLRAVGRHADAAAAFLQAQPFHWHGADNPFALMTHQPAPNSGYAVKLGSFSALYDERFSKRSRNTLDRKERRLEELGTIEYGWAFTPEDKRAVLETFFAQKSKQFAAMGITDIFDDAARAFYRDLALLDDDNPSRLRLGFIKLDGSVLATFNGFLGQNRMEVALSSLAEGETQRQSPGALLLRHQIKESCEAGYAYYDLGVGKARHKDEWCNTEHALFDSFIALKPQGLAVTLPHAGLSHLKRLIKSNRHLWTLAQSVRKHVLARNA